MSPGHEPATVRVVSRFDEFRREARRQWGPRYSIEAMADRLGISRRTLMRYAAGTSEPPVTVALAIAQDLGVTVEQLGFQRVTIPPTTEAGPSPAAP